MLGPLSFLDQASKKELEFVLDAVHRKLAEKGETPSVRPPAGTVFSIPDGTKYLTAEQLENAAQSFLSWCAGAKTPVQERSRHRVWLVFLLTRYGAMRLGEVLALDDRTDVHLAGSQVIVRDSHKRRVLLPKPIMRSVSDLVSSPMFSSLRGKIFHLDPGYLRRKFYERARACGLPGGLFNPRIIRHSRAIELLCGGVPLQVVQSFLGRRNPDSSAGFLEFSGKAARKIVGQFIVREDKMKTSARNSFTGRISKVVRDGLLAEVEITTLAGLQIAAVITEESLQNLRLTEGVVATAIIKAPWVVLSLAEESAASSARNCFTGTVSEIKSAQVACEVVTDLADGTKVCALVTRESLEKMRLEPGLEVQVMFKAFSVIINVD